MKLTLTSKLTLTLTLWPWYTDLDILKMYVQSVALLPGPPIFEFLKFCWQPCLFTSEGYQALFKWWFLFFFKSYENRKSKLIHIIRRYEFVKKLCINKYHKCLKLLCPLFTDLPVFSGNFWKPNIIGTFGISSLISSLPGVS